MNKNTVLRLAIFCFIGFLLAAINLNDVSVIENDANVSQFVINNQISWVTDFSSFLSLIFEPIYVIVFIFILSVLLWAKKFKQESVFLVFVSAMAAMAIYLLKNLFIRARPALQFLTETGYSFPSGHALISVILFGSLLYFSLKLKSNWSKISLVILSVLGILILGLSRVYLNVHWFSDVIGSYFSGLTILFVGIFLFKANIFQRLINQFYPK